MPDAINRDKSCRTTRSAERWVLSAGDKPGPYLLRVKLAPGARIPPHSHPEERSGTVFSGTVHLGFQYHFR